MSDLADILRVLARVRVARPAELQAALGISQPTLSRLIARAGAQVFRMGRGRATQYARTRTIQGLESPLPIFRVSDTGAVTDAGDNNLHEDVRTFAGNAALAVAALARRIAPERQEK